MATNHTLKTSDNVLVLKELIKELSPEESILLLSKKFQNKTIFSTSLGIEDQAITEMIYRTKADVKIFTLDTGRHFEETYELYDKTVRTYDLPIEVFYPESKDIENLYRQKGAHSFYNSVEDRKECCYLRKVKPLKRALSGMDLWITGIRREQSENRNSLDIIEIDESNQIFKYHPILEWDLDRLKNHIKTFQIPINILHGKKYPSIGCAPCTKAVKEGDDIRSGRWWWENSSNRECGLHSHDSGGKT